MAGCTRRQATVFSALFAPALLAAREAAAQVKLRVSLDTSSTHIRTVQVGRYLDALKRRSNGAIEPELFHSGQLFRDRDVGRALRQGSVDMAVPGTWIVTGLEPNADFVALPALFGQPREVLYKVSDGEVGQTINKLLEAKLRIKVIGPWLDLGYSNTYAVKPISRPGDMAGLKIRTSGGHGQFLRVDFFGGVPNFTAWPDVPLALSQGTFDGLISTNESIASAKLWESGLKFALQDYQFYGQYMPMVSEAFLRKVPAEPRKLIADVWNEMIGDFRNEANAAQAKAGEAMAANGMTVTTIDQPVLADIRRRMLPMQDRVAGELKLDPALVSKIAAAASA